MFKDLKIKQYTSLNSKSDLDTLKRFTLKQDVIQDETHNIGVVFILADKLEASSLLISEHKITFLFNDSLNKNVFNIVRDLWLKLVPGATADNVKYNMWANLNVKCITLDFRYDYTHTTAILSKESKLRGLYVREGNGYIQTEFNRRQIIEFLWENEILATSDKTAQANLTYSRQDIQAAEQLADIYLQRMKNGVSLSAGFNLWLTSYAQALRKFIKILRWPNYKQFLTKIKPIIQNY